MDPGADLNSEILFDWFLNPETTHIEQLTRIVHTAFSQNLPTKTSDSPGVSTTGRRQSTTDSENGEWGQRTAGLTQLLTDFVS